MTDKEREERERQESARQEFEVVKTMQSPGYVYIKEFWLLQREVIINKGKKAALEGNEKVCLSMWGAMDGIDKAIQVPENIKRQFDERLEEESKKQTEDSNG